MRLEQFAKILEDKNVGVRSKDIFIHYMPESAKSAIGILNSLAGYEISGELPKWRPNGAFQIISRDPKVSIAQDKMELAIAALTIEKRVLIPSMGPNIPALFINYCRRRHDPIVYSRSEGSLWEVSTNFNVAYAIN